MEINVQPMQLHNKIDLKQLHVYHLLIIKRLKAWIRVAKVANRILNIIQKYPMEFTVKENMSSRRVFIIFPEITDFFTSNREEQRLWEKAFFFLKASAYLRGFPFFLAGLLHI